MGLSRLEQETGLIWNEAENLAILWTVSNTIKRRMRKRLGEPTKVTGPTEQWEFPRLWVILPRKPRVVSDAVRLAAAERLKLARAGKGTQKGEGESRES